MLVEMTMAPLQHAFEGLVLLTQPVAAVGDAVGTADGSALGAAVAGVAVGAAVVGIAVGFAVGCGVGDVEVGTNDGCALG